MRRCAQENKEKRAERLVFLRHFALFYGQQIRVLTQFLRTTAQAAARSCFCRAEISSSILLFNRGNNTRFSGVDIDQALLRSICEDLALIREKGIVLSSEIADGIRMHANRNLLERAVSNLILNAYRYGNENGRIRVSLYETGERIVLEVKDDGIGIAEEDIAKVFDRFYRAERSRTKSGTGFGLSLTATVFERFRESHKT